MKAMGTGLLSTVLVATAALAGEPARGKVCDYDPHAFGKPDPGTVGQYNCATSQNGEALSDWSLGGNTNNGATKVRIRDVGEPPHVRPECHVGRESQVLIEKPGVDRGEWVFPRFLKCP
jgi:hypothetical protein